MLVEGLLALKLEVSHKMAAFGNYRDGVFEGRKITRTVENFERLLSWAGKIECWGSNVKVKYNNHFHSAAETSPHCSLPWQQENLP
jgi:hypothetical protein